MSDLGFEIKILFCCSFWLIFCPLDPDPWIRIFLRIPVQEAKILRIQRIQILSTEFKLTLPRLHYIAAFPEQQHQAEPVRFVGTYTFIFLFICFQ